jgi:hypothetical protein
MGTRLTLGALRTWIFNCVKTPPLHTCNISLTPLPLDLIFLLL